MTYENNHPAARRNPPGFPPGAVSRPPGYPDGAAPPPAGRDAAPTGYPAAGSTATRTPPGKSVWLARLAYVVAAVSFIGTGTALFRRGLFLVSHGQSATPALGYLLVALGVALTLVLPIALLVAALRRRA